MVWCRLGHYSHTGLCFLSPRSSSLYSAISHPLRCPCSISLLDPVIQASQPVARSGAHGPSWPSQAETLILESNIIACLHSILRLCRKQGGKKNLRFWKHFYIILLMTPIYQEVICAVMSGSHTARCWAVPGKCWAPSVRGLDRTRKHQAVSARAPNRGG